MPARFHVDMPLRAGDEVELPATAARHVQVLRLQPGAAITLFNGEGGEWDASVLRMGRSQVGVRIQGHRAVDRELPLHVTLACGMPANERMDTLVEKATELGVARIEPLICQRSVLRVEGERALRKLEHWKAVAVAACEQCGRTRVPELVPVQLLAQALAAGHDGERLFVLSLREGALPWHQAVAHLAAGPARVRLLSGPEGGLTDAEEQAAVAAGARPVSLGPRVLRADTAPLAALAALAAMF